MVNSFFFFYPKGGGAILTITDAIHMHLDSETPQFQFILPRHEQGAGHMAEGYSAATGEVGVCLVTSGPGRKNVIKESATSLFFWFCLVVFFRFFYIFFY